MLAHTGASEITRIQSLVVVVEFPDFCDLQTKRKIPTVEGRAFNDLYFGLRISPPDSGR